MKCLILFSGNNKKNTMNLLSAEFAHRVVNVRIYKYMNTYFFFAHLVGFIGICLILQENKG